MLKKQLLPAALLCVVLAACGGNNDENNGNTNNVATNNTATNNVATNNTATNNAGNCDGVADACTTPGSSCSGDSAVICAADANGCLVETTTDCAAGGQICSGGACIDDTPCSDDAACTGLTDGARFCTGDTLTTCADNGQGCLLATTNDCAATGGSCDMDTQTCVTACTDDPACVGMAAGDSFCSATGAAITMCADANADGCLEATDTACAAGESCNPATTTCSAACPDAIATLSCADAGMTINGSTLGGSSVLNGNSCTFAGEDYSGAEAIYVFSDAGANDVTISFTFDNTVIELDAFALRGTGACTDASLACEGYDYGFSGSGELSFATDAGQPYYFVLEPYEDPAETTGFGITIDCTPIVCGDGALGGNEVCDDGDMLDGDGCSAGCVVEFGYECPTPGVACSLLPSIGTFNAGDTIADTTGGPLVSDDLDFYTIELSQDMLITLNLTSDTGDPDVYFFAEDGTYVTGAAVDGPEMDRQLALLAGKYYVAVSAYYLDADIGSYTLTMTSAALALPNIGTFAAGDTIMDQTGGPLTAGGRYHYEVTFSTDVTLDIAVAGNTTGTPGWVFYNADGSPERDQTTGDIVGTVPAGRYVVAVLASSTNGDVDAYTLSITAN